MSTASPLGERRTVRGHGIDLSISVAGAGPLVILMHGWPEQSLSWRHQVPALVAAVAADGAATAKAANPTTPSNTR